MKIKWSKPYIAVYSLIISALLSLPIKLIDSSYAGFSIFPIFSTALWIFLAWIYVRWVASTAEKAGRSYVGFMLIAIFFAWIAWLIVLMFKKPEPKETAEL
jgi:hypothetical protein